MTKQPRKKTKHWSTEKKIQVVMAYLVLGKMPMVEAATGVPAGTIHQWKRQEWWDELVRQVRVEENIQLDARLSKILSKTLDIVEDRLDNGDWMYDPKEGNITRIPVKLRDAAAVSDTAWNRRDAVRNMLGEKEAKQTGVKEALQEIAAGFAALVQGKANDKEVSVNGSGELPSSEDQHGSN